MNPWKVYVTLVFGLAMSGPSGLVTGRFTTEQIDQLGKACGGSEDDLAIAKAYAVPTSESGKCLMKCMISRLGLLNENGSYNKTGMEDALKKYWKEWPTDIVEKINNKCYDEAQKVTPEILSTCDYAFTVMACINTQAKLLGVL